MEVFGMVAEAEKSFDFLHDTTQNDSMSFRLDTSSIAVGGTAIGEREAETEADNYDFYSNSNEQREHQKPRFGVNIGERESPRKLPFKDNENRKSYKHNNMKPKIGTRKFSSSKNNNVTTTFISPIARPRLIEPQTPAGIGTTNTESGSFVNGFLSPFSPLLHSTNLANIVEEEQAQRIKDQRNENLQYVSLQPCRKVSIVVRVTAVDDDEDGSEKRCIFPHYKDDITGNDAEMSTDQAASVATPTGKPNSKNTHQRNVVVVNPTAFGRYVPSQVTKDIAKLVAQVANISSEDWARLYEFHHVMWPQSTTTKKNERRGVSSNNKNNTNDTYNTLDSLSRAVVQDLLIEHRSSLLISLGEEGSCIGTTDDPSSMLGLWPKIMNLCSAMLEMKGVVRLTMVEILEPPSSSSSQNVGDSFRDLLVPSNQKASTISLRHSDMKGAILVGLTEVSIDSMPALLEALSRSKQRRAQRRRARGSRENSTATAVIGTLYYWDNAVSFKVNKSSNATVTCVELSSNEGVISSNSRSSNNNDKSNKGLTTLESITHRKSAVSLGQALRQLLLHDNKDIPSSELPPAVSYRETTLTKVLQRSMESSKIVLIASVSPLSKDYDQTVATLNYLRRLLVKPGNTLTSPFQTKNSHKQPPNATMPKTAKTSNRTNINHSLVMSPDEATVSNEALQNLLSDPRHLETLITDPRQRLAKLFQGAASPTRKKEKPWTNVLDQMQEEKPSSPSPSFSHHQKHKQRRHFGQNNRNPERKESDAVASTSTPIAAVTTATDSNTVDSNSISREDPNSYNLSPEESRQVVDSSGSVQPLSSWRQEYKDDEGNNVHDYEISYNQGDRDHNDEDDDDDDDDEWASEEEIERELLKSARLKRSLENKIDGVVTLYPEENFSDDANNGFNDNDVDVNDDKDAIEEEFQVTHDEHYNQSDRDHNDEDDDDDDDDDDEWASEEEIEHELLKSARLKRSLEKKIDDVVTLYPKENFSDDANIGFNDNDVDVNDDKDAIEVEFQVTHDEHRGRYNGEEKFETKSSEWYEPDVSNNVRVVDELVSHSDHGDFLKCSIYDPSPLDRVVKTLYYEKQGPQYDNVIEQSPDYNEQEPPVDDQNELSRYEQGTSDDGDVVVPQEETHDGNFLGRIAEGLVGIPADDTANTAKVINHHSSEEFSTSDDGDDHWCKETRYDGPLDNNDNHGKDREGTSSEVEVIELSTHSHAYGAEEEDDDKTLETLESLDLEPLAKELIQNSRIVEHYKAVQEDSNRQSYFTGEVWQEGNADGVIREDAETDSLGGYTNVSLGLKPIKNDSRIEEKAESSVAAAASNFLDTGPQNVYEMAEYVETQTNYDLIDAETDSLGGDTNVSLGLKPIKNDSRIEEKAESSVAAAASNFLDTGSQNAYELIESSLPINNSVNRSYAASQPSPPTVSGSNHRKPKGGNSISSPYRDRSAFNSFASPYSVTFKTTRSTEFTEIAVERDELLSSLEALKESLRKVSEDCDGHIREYEGEIQQLHAKLDEAVNDQREIEKVANDAINAQISQEQDIQNFCKERKELLSTIESLRKQVKQVSEDHENYLLQHKGEIDAFHSIIGNVVNSHRTCTLKQIADDVVTAHKFEVEQTRTLTLEQDELQMTIETLQSNLRSLEKDHGDHVKRYQQEIRQSADDTRLAFETQSEKMHALSVERDELRSSLSSVKDSAKKISGVHTDSLRRHTQEIQQLHDKLDKTLSEKLAIEKSADENRFAKNDLKRKMKNIEDELSDCRANNIRLEGIQREEQDKIRKLNVELRKKSSERMEIEKFQNELIRLNRHKDHLESLVSHRKVEYSGVVKGLKEKCTEVKSKNLVLEEEISSTRMKLSTSQKQGGELTEKLRSLYETSSRLSREVIVKDETMERLQSTYNHIESLRKEDQETIRNLNGELRNRESESLDVDQLHHEISRLKQGKDHLQNLIESNKIEYEKSMDERENEISEYTGQMNMLKGDLDDALQSNQKFRSDAEAQLRSLQQSESNLIQNLRQKDVKINRLQDEIVKQKEEVSSLHRREVSCSSSSEHEIYHLKKQLNNFEINLESTIQEKEEALSRVKNESRSHKTVLSELEKSRAEVRRLKCALTNLDEELNDRQQDALRADEKMFEMESTFRKFKAETKARVNSVVSDSSTILERTRHKNRDLTDNLKNLHGMVETLRRERDACFKSLIDGQQKLSQISNSVYGLDDILETPQKQQGSCHKEWVTTSRSSRPAVASVAARSSRMTGTFPEIYVTNYNLGDVDLSSRAEDIAACVVISAINSTEEKEEVSQLRSQIYRLEDESSAEVSALKAKIRNLASVATNSTGNRDTTVRFRNPSYFVDGDEQQND